MWPTVFKILGGSLLACAVVWGLVLAWWQSNDFEPSRLDLALYLGAMPLALIGGFLLLRGFIENMQNPPAAPVPANTAAVRDEDPLAVAKAKTAEAERWFRIGLIDSFVACAVGTTRADVLAAAVEGRRPGPNARIADSDGFPVFMAEIGELDLDAVIEGLADASPAIQSLAQKGAVIRELAIVEELLAKAKDRIGSLPNDEKLPWQLRIVWMLPPSWQAVPVQALRAWMQERIGAGLPAVKPEISVVFASSNSDACRQIDEIILRANRDTVTQELTLLLAAVSYVDEQTVEHLEAASELFTAKHQNRTIPGEGGAALLLAPLGVAQRLAADETVALSRINPGQRDKSIDAPGRVSGRTVAQLLSGLLDVTGVDAAKIGAVIGDGDHRPNRMSELMEGVQALLEHLDPAVDCFALGTVSGNVQPAGGLLAVACAQEKVLENQNNVFCLSNFQPIERAALMVMPLELSSDESSTTRT